MRCESFEQLITAIKENKQPILIFSPPIKPYITLSSLHNNGLNDELNSEKILLLNEALKNNRTLKKLDIKTALIEADNLKLLSRGINNNYFLTELLVPEKLIMGISMGKRTNSYIMDESAILAADTLKKIEVVLCRNQVTEKKITDAINLISRSNKMDLLAPNSKNDLSKAIDTLSEFEYALCEDRLQQMVSAVLSSSLLTGSPLVNIEKNMPTALPLLFKFFIKNKDVFNSLLVALEETNKEWWIAYRIMLNPTHALFKDNNDAHELAKSSFKVGVITKKQIAKDEARLTIATIPKELFANAWDKEESEYLSLTDTDYNENTALTPTEDKELIVDATSTDSNPRERESTFNWIDKIGNGKSTIRLHATGKLEGIEFISKVELPVNPYPNELNRPVKK